MKNSKILLTLLLSGCASIDLHTPPPAGWPRLAITEHIVSHKDMRDHCAATVSALSAPLGCAYLDLDKGTCDIWLSRDAMPQWIVDHEHAHCAGFDHPGGTTIARLFNAWGRK